MSSRDDENKEKSMNSIKLVTKTIKGENNTGITPVYGWLFDCLADKLKKSHGGWKKFEDEYQFDLAHIFTNVFPYNMEALKKIAEDGTEITPDVALQVPLNDVDDMSLYQSVKDDLKYYHEDRQRFCYVQSYGIFEACNAAFGIENHLCYMLLYPDEMKEFYARQLAWNLKYIHNVMDLGVDMVHISDDWGSQKSLLFSPKSWKEFIYPGHKKMAEEVKKRGKFLSLHSDGWIREVVDDVVEIGYDLMHPWQENAGMSYDLYLNNYQNKIALMGGLCVQSVLGFGKYDLVEREIRKVFSLLKNKRWIFCTTHFVDERCSVEELVFAYELACKLAGKK